MKPKTLPSLLPLLAAFLLSLPATSCSIGIPGKAEKLHPSGITASKAFSLPDFDYLHAAYNYQVELIPSPKDSLYVETDSILMPYLRIQCENGKLILDLDARIRTDNAGIKAKLFCQDLKSIRCSGAASATSHDTLCSKELDIRISGASFVRIPLKTGKLQVKCSGASQFGGHCDANQAVIQLSGASFANPGGHIRQGSMKLSGASSFKSREMAFDRLEVKTSGASNANMTVIRHLKAEASGASDIRYYGNPETSVSSSGAGSVKPGKQPASA